MHGGGFSAGSRDNKNIEEFCKYASNNGYVGISISYRLLRKGAENGFGCNCSKHEKQETFKQAVIDYLDATKFIVEHAEELQIDTTKIIAGGSSAGAETVLNAVFMRNYFVDELEDYSHLKFAGVFSCAGGVVDASYLTKDNAVRSVLFHGTNDKLVPFDNAPHHYCEPTRDGYIFMDGSNVIAKKLDELETAFYFNIVKEGGHEVAGIPFSELDEVFKFFERTVLNNNIVQTKIIQTKRNSP